MAKPLSYVEAGARKFTNTRSYQGFLAAIFVWIGIGIYGKLYTIIIITLRTF